jgi:hypothetical protein
VASDTRPNELRHTRIRTMSILLILALLCPCDVPPAQIGAYGIPKLCRFLFPSHRLLTVRILVDPSPHVMPMSSMAGNLRVLGFAFI